jgi:hypothetical protein
MPSDMLLLINNSEVSIKKFQLINEFNKVVGYKINIQKPVPLLYINIESSQIEIKKTTPFIIASK